MLGNLLFVQEELNAKLKNLPAKEKLKMLRTADYPLDPTLKKTADWSDDSIQERTRAIARLLHEKILRF